MMKKLGNKELMMTKVMVDDNEQIQRVILENKDKPSQPATPFYKYFEGKK